MREQPLSSGVEETQPTPALRVAVVGLGWWGRIIVPLLKTSHKLRVVKGVDPTPAGAEFAAAQQIPYSSAFEETLGDPEVEGVVLCTPHTLHAEPDRRRGRREEARVLREAAVARPRRRGARGGGMQPERVELAVGHEKRFEPPIQELMRLAKAGELGTLLQIEANFSQDKFLSLPPDNWRLSEKEAPAGPMTATGIHLLDLSVGLLGPAQQVYARVRQLGSQLVNGDTLGILVTHKSGANSLISAVLATPFDGRFALYGNKGWAEVRDKAHPEAPEGWTLDRASPGSEKKMLRIPAGECRARQPRGLRRRRGKRAPYPVPQEQMIANVSALEAVFRSVKSGTVERVEN